MRGAGQWSRVAPPVNQHPEAGRKQGDRGSQADHCSPSTIVGGVHSTPTAWNRSSSFERRPVQRRRSCGPSRRHNSWSRGTSPSRPSISATADDVVEPGRLVIVKLNNDVDC